jgi:hypothetical protein
MGYQCIDVTVDPQDAAPIGAKDPWLGIAEGFGASTL